MATSIQINLNDELEAALNRSTDELNTATPGEDVTPAQHLRDHVRDWLRNLIQGWAEREQLGLRAAYKAAPENIQAQVDTLLDPYR